MRAAAPAGLAHGLAHGGLALTADQARTSNVSETMAPVSMSSPSYFAPSSRAQPWRCRGCGPRSSGGAPGDRSPGSTFRMSSARARYSDSSVRTWRADTPSSRATISAVCLVRVAGLVRIRVGHECELGEPPRHRLGLAHAAPVQRPLEVGNLAILPLRVSVPHQRQAFHLGLSTRMRPFSTRTLNVRSGS